MDIKYTTLDSAINAVSKNGLEIKYCSPELICDINVLKTAVRQNYYVLREIKNIKVPNTNELVINNKNLMFELIKIDARVFRDIGSNLKDDEEITLYAVERYGAVLKDASNRLQNNKKIILTALSNSIYALDGVRINEELKNDKEIALLILKYRHNRINIRWFGNKLKQEIIDALGYDITLEPLNTIVIEHVKNYLKCMIEGKEFIKPENPFIKKEEPKKENKIEIKQETKKENKIEIKEEPKKEENKIEKKEDSINNSNIQANNNIVIENEIKKLNMLKEAIQKNIIKTNEFEKQLNLLKQENEQLKHELNNCANNIKKIVLEFKK